MPFDPSNLPDDFETEELTDHKFKIGYWLTAHRLRLYQALIIALVVFDVLLGGYNLYKWGDYMIFGYLNDSRMINAIAQPLSNTKILREHFAPQPIAVENSTVFPQKDKTDAVAWVRNPNDKYLVFFDYNFFVGGAKTVARPGFLLPNEFKPVAELGVKVMGAGEANLEIKNIKWQRINAHQVKDIPAYINERLNFEATNFKFIPAYSLGSKESRISFKIVNNSFYGFWQADFWVVLKVGEMAVGIEKISLDQFKSEEKRDIDLSVSPSINPNNIQVVPDIRVFDNSIFFK